MSQLSAEDQIHPRRAILILVAIRPRRSRASRSLRQTHRLQRSRLIANSSFKPNLLRNTNNEADPLRKLA